jgi:hypothetical protein
LKVAEWKWVHRMLDIENPQIFFYLR